MEFDKVNLYSIGHSNREIGEFLSILKKYSISIIVDIRTFPYSKVTPWFNNFTLKDILYKNNIKYVFMGESLGGKWNAKNYLFENGCVNYQLVMKDPLFLNGIERLLKGINKKYIICLMCSEKDPGKCHRSILIGRYLLSHYKINVKHILDLTSFILQTDIEDELKYEILKGEIDLFMKDEEILEKAYEQRNKKIAYRIEKN